MEESLRGPPLWRVVATDEWRRRQLVMYRGMASEAEAHALAEMLNRQRTGVVYSVEEDDAAPAREERD